MKYKRANIEKIMNDSEPFLALVPCRNVDPILRPTTVQSNEKVRPYIEVSQEKLGRTDFLCCLYRACECSDNPKSSHEKCLLCTAVTLWMTRFIPRSNWMYLAPSLSKDCVHIHFESSKFPLECVFVGHQSIEAKERTANCTLKVGEYIEIRPPPLEESVQWLPWRAQLRRIAILEGKIRLVQELDRSSVAEKLLETQGHPLPDDWSSLTKRSDEDDPSCVGNTEILNCAHGKRDSDSSTGQHEANVKPPLEESTKEPPNDQPMFKIYIVRKGRDMNNAIVTALEKRARARGAAILEHFDKEKRPWPDFFIVSDTVQQNSSIPNALGFTDQEEMGLFLFDHGVRCVRKCWIDKGYSPLQVPTFHELYHAAVPQRRKRKDLGDPRINSPCQKKALIRHHNEELSHQFKTMAKLHKECAFNETEEWKSYTFSVLAGRVRQLGYPIIDTPDCLNKISQTKGFGESSVKMIKEFLRDGKIERITKFQTSTERTAMRNMMRIWGVGRSKAYDLVKAGFGTINQVRKALSNGKLRLDRNQLIGVLHYEDILEEMSRHEVESIASIVETAFKDRFPSAEVTIMGSYRREKASCGDVDILVTHPDYSDEVPPQALGRVVDSLREEGHIRHHLTFISGMKHEKFESIQDSMQGQLTKKKLLNSDRKDKFSSSSYMGVFNSPIFKDKVRRVDIKFYPFKEKIFAALYFTGNGHFNRSMRLWAKRKCGFELNDHGLFREGSIERVIEANTEHEVFAKLGIVWKEPKDRNWFDDVEGLNGENSVDYAE